MIVLLIIAYLGLILFEVPGLIREKSWRELVVFSFLISIGFLISLLETLNVDIPNPVKNAQYYVQNLLHLSYE